MSERELEGTQAEGLKSQIIERVSLLSSHQIPSGRPIWVEDRYMVAARIGQFDLQPAVKCADGCTSDKTKVVLGYIDAWVHPKERRDFFGFLRRMGHEHHPGRGFVVFSNNDHSEMLDFEEDGTYQVGRLGKQKKKAEIDDLDFFNSILDKVMNRRAPTVTVTA